MTSAEGTDNRFASLIPQLGVEMAAADVAHQVIDGSMLSADISGFTALSEKLAHRGKAGAEDLTLLINVCFTQLIEASYDFGGEIIKFGGDALLILFRGDNNKRRCAAAGLAMQKALAQSSDARKANLTMTVGASEGPFDAFLVGSLNQDLLICGTNASHVIHLEGSAAKGDTLVSTAIADELDPALRVGTHAGGWIIAGEVDQPKTGPAKRIVVRDQVKSLLPSAVEAQFDGFAGLGGEHRIVTVGFLSISDVDDHLEDFGPKVTGEALGQLTAAVQDACEEFGATPLHTDIAPGGLKFLLCAGAPFTRGNTSDAILEAALKIVRTPSPFALRIGVQQGRVFAGFLGSTYRRTYTIMGDPVNTAARMLGKANDRGVVAVSDVLATTRRLFATESLEPFTVKGKTELIDASVVFATTDWIQREAPAAPLIGRDRELEQLFESLDADLHAVQIVGPAGSGKSRLLEALRERTTRDSIRRIEASCSPYSATTPYALLQVVIRRVADIEATSDPQTAGELLYKAVRHLEPDLLPMLPILAIPAGAEVESTPEADAIDSKFLRDRIHETSALFLRSALGERAVFMLEDMQWVDDASSEFLEYLLGLQTSFDWTAFIATREGGNWDVNGESGQRTTVTLDSLSDSDVRKLVLAAASTDLPDSALNQIVPKASGNPLYAIELTKALESSGGSDIPDSVEQLIAARVDALEPELRTALRVASVFGTHFRSADLASVLSADAPDMQSVSEFVRLDRNGSFSFTNALYRDVAYEGLPFAQRKRLHLAVGERLESESGDPDAIAGLLAAHYAEAHENAKTWTYGVIAGDEAASKAANVEAAASYERALGASSRLRVLDPKDLTRVAIALGDVQEILGQFEAAERAYGRARKASQVVDGRVAAMLKIGGLREKQGRYRQASRWYERADAEIPDAESPEVRLLRSQVAYQRSGLSHRQNNNQQCIIEARLALGGAEDANDLPAMARALHRLHLATIYLGRRDRIGYGDRALEFFTELGDFERQASVLNNLGIEHYFADRWTEASEFYQLATEAGLRAGSAIDGMLGSVNSAEIMSDQGHWDKAIELLETARRNFEGGRYPMGAAMVKLYLGIALHRSGSDERAHDVLVDSLNSLSELGLDDAVEDARARLLEADIFAGTAGYPHAKSMLAGLGPDSGLVPRATYLCGLAAGIEGLWDEQRDSVIGLLETQAGYDRALTLRLLDKYEGDSADPNWARESSEILAGLGVVRLRPLL